MYVKRVHKSALDYSYLTEGAVLVNVYLHDMMKKYRIFQTICLSVFFQIEKAASRTNESVHRTSRSSQSLDPATPPWFGAEEKVDSPDPR